ncbi:MAG: hypothetical protein RRY08_06680, partial [Christensenella sp.]
IWKHSAFIGTGVVGNRMFSHYRTIKGSSEYDKKEMSRLIDGIVYEAKQLGIETFPPQKIKAMCEIIK